ncbi:MAG: site-2 protease family protein [Deltaproteobacteria bacterium]|nr:site-2 protease family protein [Deltaproteobacteria bacterium]MBW1875917.1 site-2 protease family protein [Deltaproteobacteria bacterium]MBW2212501.1 site-2 protease family protein [Deltaproteobacteria bacterium]MBW2215309.1 site-2 protease family protein [Deltaproteobacteria bacterium]MBW2380397.1 site-2 protease family protein [Deltaproteobacteria bacterium]
MSLARIFGIEIRLDFSVLIVFALVVYSLGAALFPRWHPTWDATLTWGTAFTAGVLFFASLLAHELAHSVVAKLRGIPVPRITLFVFGGVSELDREPDTPATEFLIAIVGPAMSALLGFVFSWLGAMLAGADFGVEVFKDPEAAMAHLGPAATLFLWLGPINFMLAVFNLVPGFPLDGGRVLRAILWGISGDLRSATQWASNMGRAFAWALMGFGVLQALGGSFVQGVWLLLIGWFLNNAARNSYVQLLVQQAFDELIVGNLMRTHFEVVDPDLTLEAFVNEFLLRSAQSAWPVIEDGKTVGLITFDDARVTSEDERATQTVRDVMSPIGERLSPDVGGRDALRALAESERDPLPVMRGEHIVGLLHRGDITRWLALHQLDAHQHQ